MWDARFEDVIFLTPLGHTHVTSGVTGADVTFQTAWQDAVPLNDGQLLVGPGIYRTVLVFHIILRVWQERRADQPHV